MSSWEETEGKCTQQYFYAVDGKSNGIAINKNSTKFITFSILPVLMEQYLTGFAKRWLIYTHIQFSILRTCNSACICPAALKFGSMTFLSLHVYDRNFWLSNIATNEVMLLQSPKIGCVYKRLFHKSTHM